MFENVKVLIIDNEMAVHRFVCGAIDPICRHPVQTRTGAEGVVLAKIHRPDVVLIDLDLPDTEGLSVVRVLRKEIDAQIIVTSKRWGTADQASAMLAGADSYLLKPFFKEELMDRIESRTRVKVA